MSEAQAAPVAPAPDPARRHEVASPPAGRAVARRGSTPDRYRRWSLVAAGVCALASIVGSVSVSGYTSAATRIQHNAGPVLVTTQTLLGSLAEADAAATTAFLSGTDEDPTARRAHLDARGRATAQLEDISALIGTDAAAHGALKDVTENLTQYVGLVEAARATNLAELPAAETYLQQAVETLSGPLTDGTARLTAASQRRLDEDASALGARSTATILVMFLALLVLVGLQVRLAKSARRILNLPLVAASAALLVCSVWSLIALTSSRSALDEAKAGAFDAITRTADLQAAAYGAFDAQTLALITGAADDVATADARTDAVVVTSAADAADTDRELARVGEGMIRWTTYLAERQRLDRASTPLEVQASFGQLTQAFNGFSFTMEGLLADNTGQFFDGLETATSRTRGLPTAVLLLPALAGLLALAGFQLRINEYR